MVGDTGNWVNEDCAWDFRWRRELSVGEHDLLESLLEALDGSLSFGVDDS
ncbi:hypothetical protein A2U01_0101176, partial [Trifolium medium]|nr:hypothetical protein [Trifolium medium]